MNKATSDIRGLLFRIAGEKYRELVIIALAWRTVIGDFLLERYKITKYENKILYIEAINHVWMQDFILQRPVWTEKLREVTKIDIEKILVVTKK